MLPETESQFTQEKRANYELAIIPKVFDGNGINETIQCVKDKRWNHDMPLPAYFCRDANHFHCVKSVQTRSYFWSVFSRIWTEYGEIQRISLYSVRMRENTD